VERSNASAGIQDSNLTKNGIHQAKMVAKALSAHRFDILISSDLEEPLKQPKL
jgi:broad specificity phosphatase PhoE